MRGPPFLAVALPFVACATAAPCDVFCVDFEHGAPAGFSFGKKAKVVTNKGHGSSGSSLYFSTKGNGDYDAGFMRYTKSLKTKHYGRIFYNLEKSDPGGSSYTHTSFVMSDTNPQVRVVDTVRMKDGKQQYLYNFADDQDGKGSSYDYKVETDKWVCAEWHIDSSKSTYEFWVNGELVSDISGTVPKGRSIPATYPNLAFGGQVYQGGAAVSGWIDDIEVSTTRVGCDTPPQPPAPPVPPAPPAPGPAKCAVQSGVDCDGNDIRDGGVTGSAAECCALCTAQSGCTWWTWNRGYSKHCWLKSACPHPRKDSKADSGNSTATA